MKNILWFVLCLVLLGVVFSAVAVEAMMPQRNLPDTIKNKGIFLYVTVPNSGVEKENHYFTDFSFSSWSGFGPVPQLWDKIAYADAEKRLPKSYNIGNFNEAGTLIRWRKIIGHVNKIQPMVDISHLPGRYFYELNDNGELGDSLTLEETEDLMRYARMMVAPPKDVMIEAVEREVVIDNRYWYANGHLSKIEEYKFKDGIRVREYEYGKKFLWFGGLRMSEEKILPLEE